MLIVLIIRLYGPKGRWHAIGTPWAQERCSTKKLQEKLDQFEAQTVMEYQISKEKHLNFKFKVKLQSIEIREGQSLRWVWGRPKVGRDCGKYGEGSIDKLSESMEIDSDELRATAFGTPAVETKEFIKKNRGMN